MATVVIDPGHGGPSNVGGSSWNNATAPNGTLEKDLTLNVGLAAKKALEKTSLDVIMTRETDVNVGIRARAKKAKDIRADAFVSIHFNAASSSGPPAQGTETWVESSPTKRSRQLAKRVQAAVQDVTDYRDRGVKHDNVSGVIRNKNHSGRTAHCLVEVSFIDRQPADEERLQNPAYIAELGGAIADSVMRYLQHRGLVAEQPVLIGGMPSGKLEDAASAARLGLIAADGSFAKTEPSGAAMTSAAIIENTKGKIRDRPINKKLRRVLVRAAEAAGIDTVLVTSGGQAARGSPGKRIGSTRHDRGNAADLQLLKSGRSLKFTRADDLPNVAAFAAAAAANGATGIGAGVKYMGPRTLHVGFGSKAVWGAGGKAKNAPGWLTKAVRKGWNS